MMQNSTSQDESPGVKTRVTKLQTKSNFNGDAPPFIPMSSAFNPFASQSIIDSSPNTTETPLSTIEICHIPNSITKSELKQFLSSKKIDAKDYKILQLIKQFEVKAILEVTNSHTANSIYDAIDGTELHGKILGVIVNSQPNSCFPEFPPALSRASSKSSFDSTFFRRTSSISDRIPYSKSSSFSSVNSAEPVPPFIMNMVQSKNSPSKIARINEEKEKDQTIFVPIGEGENPDQLIPVNPLRLFIGNVPFTTNWLSLKNFLQETSQNLAPDFPMVIQRVEIPTQQILSDEFSYQLFQGLPLPPQHIIMKSRGFAIVKTGSLECSNKLIELFDNIEFGGRKLTVRFDKFPQYTNYFTHPAPSSDSNYNSLNRPRSTSLQNPSIISNLAIERNSLQHRYYYGSDSNSFNPTLAHRSSFPANYYQVPEMHQFYYLPYYNNSVQSFPQYGVPTTSSGSSKDIQSDGNKE